MTGTRLAALGLSLLGAQAAAIAGAQAIPLPGAPSDWRVEDVDRDGRDDVMLLFGRAFWLLRGGATGPRPVTPAPVDLPPDVSAIDAWPDPSPRLLCLAGGAVSVRRLDPERFLEPVAELGDGEDAPGAIQGAAFVPLRTPDRRRVLVPGLAGLTSHAFPPEDGPEGAPRAIVFPPDHRLHVSGGDPFDRIESELVLPVLAAGDADGDGRADLVVVQRTSLLFFTAADAPPAARFALGPRTLGTRLLSPEVAPLLHDLDGDGALDLVDTDATGGTIRIHRGPLAGAEAARPASILRQDRMVLDVRAADVDGDGRPDLVVFSTERIGLLRGVRAFLGQRLPVEVLTFRQRADGGFGPTADASSRCVVPIEIDRRDPTPKGDAAALFHVEDLGGDGRADLVASRDGRTLGIHAADRKGRFAAAAAPLRPAPPEDAAFSAVVAGDFDGDGRPDLLFVGNAGGRPVLWRWAR